MNKRNLCLSRKYLVNVALYFKFLIFTSLYSVDICAHEIIAVFVVSSALKFPLD